jgi:hypothetical protein
MECSEPGAIHGDELLAYSDGAQVRPAVLAHLALCQHCNDQLAVYQRIDRKLTCRLYRWDCPTSQVLGDYQLGFLPAELAGDVEDHLKHCVLCAAELVTLTNFLAHDPFLVESPVSALQLATSVQTVSPIYEKGRTLNRWYEAGKETVRRVIATLLVSQPRLALERGDYTNYTVQWPRHYLAEDLTISVQMERASHIHQRGSLQLSGFVTCSGHAVEDLQGTSVVLFSTSTNNGSEPHSYSQVIADLGNFLFPCVEPDTYTLELQFPDHIIAVEQLSLML